MKTKLTLMTKLLDEPEDTWNRFVNRFGGYLPFTALNLCWRLLDRSNRSLLDIGCGKGRPAKFIGRHRNLFMVGTDIHLPYLKHCKNLQTHNDFVRCDVRKLPFVAKSLDAILCKEVLEHLTEGEGEKLLREIERIGRRQVIITTPNGSYRQRAYDNNPFQEHRSTWMPAKLMRLGYKVRGVGLRSMHSDVGLRTKLPRILKWLCDVVYVLAGPVVYRLPILACYMICTKRLSVEDSN